VLAAVLGAVVTALLQHLRAELDSRRRRAGRRRTRHGDR
jgi:hypothetical protein